MYVLHLQQRDETKIERLLERTNETSAQKKKSKYEILEDLQGERSGTYYEYALAESLDAEDFQAKFAFSEENWKTIVPGFHEWFLRHRKDLFEENVIQSVYVSSNVESLYYQNDIESQHAVQKGILGYKKRDIATVIKNLQRLSDRQDAEEVRAFYGAGNYPIAGPYKRYCIQSSEWLSWDENRRKDHVQKFRSFAPGKTDLFFKPRNGRRKPCCQERPKRSVPDMIIDRQENHANSIKQQTSSQQKHP